MAPVHSVAALVAAVAATVLSPAAAAAASSSSSSSSSSYGETAAWFDTSLPRTQRVSELLSAMTLDEKIDQLVVDTPAIERLGVPAYHWYAVADSRRVFFRPAVGGFHSYYSNCLGGSGCAFWLLLLQEGCVCVSTRV